MYSPPHVTRPHPVSRAGAEKKKTWWRWASPTVQRLLFWTDSDVSVRPRPSPDVWHRAPAAAACTSSSGRGTSHPETQDWFEKQT